jgi:O-acetylserine/cysteine efflux transporter
MAPRHSLLALVVVLLWGVNFVVLDEGLEGVPPLLFLALRFVIVALPCLVLPRPSIPWRDIVLIGGFLSLGQFSLLYLSLHLGMPPGLASLLLQTQVVLTALVSWALLRERPSALQFLGIGIGMAGLAVVALGHGRSSPWLPLLLVLAAALSWAVGNVLSRRAKAASGLSLVVWSAVVVPIPAFALSLVVDSPAVVLAALTSLPLAAILSTLYTAIAASWLGYGIWNSLLARYPTGAVVPFSLLIPVIGILTAWLVQGEVPVGTEIVGGAVMLTGLAVAVVRLPPRQRSKSPAIPEASPGPR